MGVQEPGSMLCHKGSQHEKEHPRRIWNEPLLSSMSVPGRRLFEMKNVPLCQARLLSISRHLSPTPPPRAAGSSRKIQGSQGSWCQPWGSSRLPLAFTEHLLCARTMLSSAMYPHV